MKNLIKWYYGHFIALGLIVIIVGLSGVAYNPTAMTVHTSKELVVYKVEINPYPDPEAIDGFKFAYVTIHEIDPETRSSIKTFCVQRTGLDILHNVEDNHASLVYQWKYVGFEDNKEIVKMTLRLRPDTDFKNNLK